MNHFDKALKKAVAKAVAAERERCAEIAEDRGNMDTGLRIRSQGDAPKKCELCEGRGRFYVQSPNGNGHGEYLKVCGACMPIRQPGDVQKKCERCSGRGWYYTRNHDDGKYLDCDVCS